MNRRQRRAAPDHLVHAIAASYVCPDCPADTELLNPSPHVWLLEVRHDDTCPWFNQRRTTP
jgi:hypothetical protein